MTIVAIQTEAVCQPEAASRPKEEAAAAASSIWKGWGSKARAKAMISSAVKTVLPSSKRSPIVMSSKKRAAGVGSAGGSHGAGEGGGT